MINLQKIKDLVTDIAVALEMTNVDTGAYIDSAKEKVNQILAEFEKPAPVDAESRYREILNERISLYDIPDTLEELEAISKECAEKRIRIIQQYAEAYHQRKCAECKKETADSKMVIERNCCSCQQDGNQMIYPSGCTGCTPFGDTSLLRNWEPKYAR